MKQGGKGDKGGKRKKEETRRNGDKGGKRKEEDGRKEQ